MITPQPWSCTHAVAPIQFGFDTPVGRTWIYSSVVSVDGKAVFSNGTAFPTAPPCRFFYTPSGVYAGVIHTVVSIDPSTGDIYTGTDFISTDSQTDGKCMINFTYRLYHGYPEPASGSYLSIKPMWKSDGTLIVNPAEFLKSLFPFPIPPPVEGPDDNMYKWYRVRVVGSQDYIDWCNANSISSSVTGFIDGYDWMGTIWFAIRGCIDHTEFNANYTGSSDLISNPAPIYSAGDTLVSKIVGNRVYNLFTT